MGESAANVRSSSLTARDDGEGGDELVVRNDLAAGSAGQSTRRMRRGAMQVAEPLRRMPKARAATTRSMSAEGSTTTASLPESSATQGVALSASRRRMSLPDLARASEEDLVDTGGDGVLSGGDGFFGDFKETCWQTCAMERRGHDVSDLGAPAAGLPEHGVPGGERLEELHAREEERVVGRSDDEDACRRGTRWTSAAIPESQKGRPRRPRRRERRRRGALRSRKRHGLEQRQKLGEHGVGGVFGQSSGEMARRDSGSERGELVPSAPEDSASRLNRPPCPIGLAGWQAALCWLRVDGCCERICAGLGVERCVGR